MAASQKQQKIPTHVAIIMDGNGRWATNRRDTRIDGHRKGVEVFEQVVKHFRQKDIKFFTVFAFAQSNFNRDKDEVDGLMSLFTAYIQEKSRELHGQNIRVTFIGNRTDGRLPSALVKEMSSLESLTRGNTGLCLQIAINYSGTDEIDRAVQAGWSVSVLSQRLFDALHCPAVDLMVRTGEDNPVMPVWRSSGFLPLCSQHAVCIALQTLWPAIQLDELDQTIEAWAAEPKLDGGQRQMVKSLAAE